MARRRRRARKAELGRRWEGGGCEQGEAAAEEKEERGRAEAVGIGGHWARGLGFVWRLEWEWEWDEARVGLDAERAEQIGQNFLHAGTTNPANKHTARAQASLTSEN